jgi:hypothetical protein
MQSTVSLRSTSSAFSVEERVGARGIKLQPDTPLFQLPVDQLHPTQLAVGMQQVCVLCVVCVVCVGDGGVGLSAAETGGCRGLTCWGECDTNVLRLRAAPVERKPRTLTQAFNHAHKKTTTPLHTQPQHQVHEKMDKLTRKQQRGPEALGAFLRAHPVPVVLGPGGKHFLIDHHHLTLAMHNLGIGSCYAGVWMDHA